jgi:hypothetical protein
MKQDWLFARFVRIFGFIVVLALLSGCKHPPMSSGHSATAPARIGYLIAGADRIVITNMLALINEKYRGFSLTISGDEARKIVKDVSCMQSFSSTIPPTMPTGSIFNWELKFYKGTNSLIAIYLADTTFIFEKEEYGGDAGELHALSDKLLKLTTSPEDR